MCLRVPQNYSPIKYIYSAKSKTENKCVYDVPGLNRTKAFKQASSVGSGLIPCILSKVSRNNLASA